MSIFYANPTSYTLVDGGGGKWSFTTPAITDIAKSTRQPSVPFINTDSPNWVATNGNNGDMILTFCPQITGGTTTQIKVWAYLDSDESTGFNIVDVSVSKDGYNYSTPVTWQAVNNGDPNTQDWYSATFTVSWTDVETNRMVVKAHQDDNGTVNMYALYAEVTSSGTQGTTTPTSHYSDPIAITDGVSGSWGYSEVTDYVTTARQPNNANSASIGLASPFEAGGSAGSVIFQMSGSASGTLLQVKVWLYGLRQEDGAGATDIEVSISNDNSTYSSELKLTPVYNEGVPTWYSATFVPSGWTASQGAHSYVNLRQVDSNVVDFHAIYVETVTIPAGGANNYFLMAF